MAMHAVRVPISAPELEGDLWPHVGEGGLAADSHDCRRRCLGDQQETRASPKHLTPMASPQSALYTRAHHRSPRLAAPPDRSAQCATT